MVLFLGRLIFERERIIGSLRYMICACSAKQNVTMQFNVCDSLIKFGKLLLYCTETTDRQTDRQSRIYYWKFINKVKKKLHQNINN